MKRFFALVLAVLMLASVLAGCGASSEKNSDAESQYGEPEAFLQDMAKGITARLEAADEEGHANDTAEEKNAYLAMLANKELEYIGKYKDVVYSNELFNQVAHAYISGCETQLISAQNYKKDDLSALWSAGASVRNPIIRYLYEYHGLPITSEQLSHYTGSGYSVTITTSDDSGDTTADTASDSAAEIDSLGRPQMAESSADDFLYVTKDNGVTIRSYKGTSVDVVIPENIDGVPVVTISEKAFYDNDTIQSVSIPKTITLIGKEAFSGCNNLKAVYFPLEKMGSLKIEGDAFAANYYVEKPIIINAQDVTLGSFVFSNNDKVPEIAFLADRVQFTDAPFVYSEAITSIFFLKDAAITYVPAYNGNDYGCVFKEMESLEEIVLPGSIDFTSEYTYEGDPKLVVYSEEGSRTLTDADAQGIPTNFKDYSAKYEAYLERYKNAGYEID